MVTEPPRGADDAVLLRLARASGLPLDSYRREHVGRQVERCCRALGLDRPEELPRRLEGDRVARARFRRAIAVSVSGRLRDSHQFDLLEESVLSGLLAWEGRLRVWSAGCADGSELYDLGTLLERRGALARAHLLGSDILEENLAAARRADGPSVSPAVRAEVRWERRDVVSEPPPPGDWHLVLCRNLAIYLEPSAREALHHNLATALAPGGWLMLGRTERIRDPERVGLAPAGDRIYRRVG